MRTPLDTVMPLPLVTTPVEFLHVTTGISEVFPAGVPLQISVYTCPATGLPDVVMFIACTETETKILLTIGTNCTRKWTLATVSHLTKNGGSLCCLIDECIVDWRDQH